MSRASKGKGLLGYSGKEGRIILKDNIRERTVTTGKFVIPEGTEVIREREYEKEPFLTEVVIPGTVKTIKSRAFADCPKLRKVILGEGIKRIEHNVFTGCGNLESIDIPHSVDEIEGWAFYGSGLKKPVFSAAGDRLIYCPREAAGSSYTVPEGVREIGVQAFIRLAELKEVILPEGLEVIRNRAFIECGFTEIVIPESVKTVETGAFSHFKELRKIRIKGEPDLVKARLEALRMEREKFLLAQALKLPEEKYWKTLNFRILARECSLGKAEAIQRMADYFEEKSEKNPRVPFYRGAFRFWQYRAMERGSAKAKRDLEKLFREHPEKFCMISSYLTEQLCGTGDGTAFRALGFFFFKEGVQYELKGKDGNGVVEVRVWVGEDGPDEDGFGREEIYNYWYLDDRLNLLSKGKRPNR